MYYQIESTTGNGNAISATLRSPQLSSCEIMLKLKRRRQNNPPYNDSNTDKPQADNMRSFAPSWLGSRKSSRLNVKTVPVTQEANGHSSSPATSDPPAFTASVSSTLTGNLESEQRSSQYNDRRRTLVADDRKRLWDAPATARASETELRAQRIVFNIREHERIDPDLFGNLPGEAVPTDKTHDMGGKFLFNLSSIEKSKVFTIAKQMPKGSHLHLHFNSEIPPERLFPSARQLAQTMYVRATGALRTVEDYRNCEIVFNVFPAEKDKSDIFSANYNPDLKADGNSPWMLWADFRHKFGAQAPREVIPSIDEDIDMVDGDAERLDAAERWARVKMVITEHHAYGDHQTHNGAWACFNQGTRAFKGLLNYEGIYRWYIGNAIDSMIADKVMYVELRPMLLDKSLPSDDGLRQLGHADQMNIICEEVRRKKKELESRGQLDKFPFGLKIIYATPRSINRTKMQSELEDCINLKLKFKDLICGFDLVGAEDRPNHIGFYADLLVAFTKTCESLNIQIPFMFHAGETLLDTGGSHKPDNSNLYDALLLNSKRIGHGYALLKHPRLVEKYREAKICLELCPISNELLHLCGNARQHPFPELLAAGLECTLNADNPSLFRGSSRNSSSLSHEFYQVMVGDPRMTIHGWKQLAEWSIEHSCLTSRETQHGKEIHAREWEKFCKWIVQTYPEYETMDELA